jgi:hypothetical protein
MAGERVNGQVSADAYHQWDRADRYGRHVYWVAAVGGILFEEPIGAVAEHHPARAQRRQAELVPRGADRLHPGQPEVKQHVRRAERGQEPAAGRVHVHVHIQAGAGVQRVQRGRDLRDRLIGAGVGDPQRRHHHDRVLIHPGAGASGVGEQPAQQAGQARGATLRNTIGPHILAVPTAPGS